MTDQKERLQALLGIANATTPGSPKSNNSPEQHNALSSDDVLTLVKLARDELTGDAKAHAYHKVLSDEAFARVYAELASRTVERPKRWPWLRKWWFKVLIAVPCMSYGSWYAKQYAESEFARESRRTASFQRNVAASIRYGSIMRFAKQQLPPWSLEDSDERCRQARILALRMESIVDAMSTIPSEHLGPPNELLRARYSLLSAYCRGEDVVNAERLFAALQEHPVVDTHSFLTHEVSVLKKRGEKDMEYMHAAMQSRDIRRRKLKLLVADLEDLGPAESLRRDEVLTEAISLSLELNDNQLTVALLREHSHSYPGYVFIEWPRWQQRCMECDALMRMGHVSEAKERLSEMFPRLGGIEGNEALLARMKAICVREGDRNNAGRATAAIAIERSIQDARGLLLHDNGDQETIRGALQQIMNEANAIPELISLPGWLATSLVRQARTQSELKAADAAISAASFPHRASEAVSWQAQWAHAMAIVSSGTKAVDASAVLNFDEVMKDGFARSHVTNGVACADAMIAFGLCDFKSAAQWATGHGESVSTYYREVPQVFSAYDCTYSGDLERDDHLHLQIALNSVAGWSLIEIGDDKRAKHAFEQAVTAGSFRQIEKSLFTTVTEYNRQYARTMLEGNDPTTDQELGRLWDRLKQRSITLGDDDRYAMVAGVVVRPLVAPRQE